MTTIHGVIPARYASTRFPGKPLVDIGGKPMFWHVYRRAVESGVFSSLVLATDDERIAEAATRHGVPFVMTRRDHPSGTDRVYEAICQRDLAPDDVVVNIQGDEPALDPRLLTELVRPFADASVRMTTVAVAITVHEAASPNQVKVVLDAAGNALYFSRAAIPFFRDQPEESAVLLGHVGLYAFRRDTLAQFVSLPPSRLERIEKLEQLRCLENGIPIRVVLVPCAARGVDTPEDLEIVREHVCALRVAGSPEPVA